MGSEMCIRDSNDTVLMLISGNLHMKGIEVSIKTWSTPASLPFKGQATKHTTVKWSIDHFTVVCMVAWPLNEN